MKILVLTSEIPATINMPGSPRLFSMCRSLSRHHHLTLATLSQSQERYQSFLSDSMANGIFEEIVILPDPPQTRWWRKQVHRFRQEAHFVTRYRTPQYHARMCRMIREMVSLGKYDVVYMDGMHMSQYVMGNKLGCPAIIDIHDSATLFYTRAMQVERHWLRKLAIYFETKSIGRWEKSLSQMFSVIITNSRVDEVFLKALDPSANTLTIGNGVDSEFFVSTEDASDMSKIVFTGVMSYGPNEDAAVYFCNDIFPLIQERCPHVHFWVVGKDPTEKVQALAQRNGVHVTGGVPDIRPYLETAGIFVCPIRYGAGIKNKILAALAMKKAVVATRVSIEGLDLRDDCHLITADDPKTFAAQAMRLIDNPKLAERLSRNGQKFVRDEYSWESSARLLDETIRQVVNRKNNSN